MKRRFQRLMSVILVMTLVVAFFVGCSKSENDNSDNTPTGKTDTEDKEKDTEVDDPAQVNPYEITGKVVIAYPEGEAAEIIPVLDAFRAQYPNIEVVDEPFPGSYGGAFNEYLTQKAAANAMPDLMWLDWNDFAPQVASGYVMPLNDFMDDDEEATYVPSGMTDPYTYGGKLYALPCQMNAMGITMNLDMLEELNIDKPSYDWTIDEFEEIVKKAITSNSCGSATLEDFDQVYSAQEDGYFYPAYDYSNQTFNFTEKWVPAMNKLAELRAVPGLDAWAMKYPKAEDGSTPLDSDYVLKFGEAGKDDNHYTFKNGISLLCTNATWNDNWMRSETKIEWDYWPYPSLDANTPIKTPIHVDCAYLTSTCQDPEAAFQLLKWLTYGLEGNLQRLDIFEARGDKDVVEGDTKLLKTWFIPCTQHPDVIAKFEQNSHLTEGFKALYKSTANSIRGDINKIVPGFNAIFNDEIWQMLGDVREGRKNAADVAPQIDAIVNAALQEQLQIFDEKVNK